MVIYCMVLIMSHEGLSLVLPGWFFNQIFHVFAAFVSDLIQHTLINYIIQFF